jgi:tetratricopeptide (TPR) repeat protein
MLHIPTRPSRWSLLLLACVVGCASAGLGRQKSAANRNASSAIASAAAQLQHNDLNAAEKTLWDVLSADPSNQEALTLLGVIRARQQRFAEAEALFRRVLQINPKSIVAARNLAGALLAQHKPEDALKEYKRAIELAPQDINLRMDAVQLELDRGSFADALAILDGIKPKSIPPATVPFRAACLLGLNRRSEAEALIPIVRMSPKAAADLAQVFVEGNDSDAALKALAYAKAADKPGIARIHYLRGRALLQKGDFGGAMGAFRQVLVAEPTSTQVMLSIAEVYATENKHAESYGMLEKARAVDPQSPDVLRHLVIEGMRAGHNEKALQAAMDLQRISPTLDDRYLVATVMLQQKQFVPASHILEDYVAQRPQDAKAFLGLGMAYLNLLRYSDARKALERSLQLDPDLAEAEYELGLLESQQGNRRAAQQHWERAVELKPDHAPALFSLGVLFLESGDLAKAESAFERSLRADPTNMKTEYNLALVLNKLGKSEEAKIHLERYRKMQEAEHSLSGNPPRNSPM